MTVDDIKLSKISKRSKEYYEQKRHDAERFHKSDSDENLRNSMYSYQDLEHERAFREPHQYRISNVDIAPTYGDFDQLDNSMVPSEMSREGMFSTGVMLPAQNQYGALNFPRNDMRFSGNTLNVPGNGRYSNGQRHSGGQVYTGNDMDGIQSQSIQPQSIPAQSIQPQTEWRYTYGRPEYRSPL